MHKATKYTNYMITRKYIRFQLFKLNFSLFFCRDNIMTGKKNEKEIKITFCYLL